jgi:hypothetical protein
MEQLDPEIRQLMLSGLLGTIFSPFETTMEGMPESQVMIGLSPTS